MKGKIKDTLNIIEDKLNMKKVASYLSLLIIFIIFITNVNASKNIIPNEAIRLRVIANSNTEYDQKIKLKVRDNIQHKLYELLKETKEIDSAREIINNNLNDIDRTVEQTLKSENYQNNYTINFGQNYFPQKKYKGITYKEGYYESLVVTLGEGKGDNWWCVLFPPLCLLEAEESDEVEYKFFVQELLEKYL